MGKQNRVISLQILNWNKYQQRKDVNNPSWFRFEHGIFENPDFFDFSHSELVAWIYILAMASKKSSDTITINLAHAERIGRLKESDLHAAIVKLEAIQCVAVLATDTLRERNGDVTNACSTLQDSTRQYKTVVVEEKSDLEATPVPEPNKHCTEKKTATEKPEDNFGEYYNNENKEWLARLGKYFNPLPRQLKKNVHRIRNEFGDLESLDAFVKGLFKNKTVSPADDPHGFLRYATTSILKESGVVQ